MNLMLSDTLVTCSVGNIDVHAEVEVLHLLSRDTAIFEVDVVLPWLISLELETEVRVCSAKYNNKRAEMRGKIFSRVPIHVPRSQN